MEVEKMEGNRIVENPFRGLREIPDLDSITNAIYKRVANVNLTKNVGPVNAAKTKIGLFVQLYENRVRRVAQIYREVKSAHEFHVLLCDSIYEGGYAQLTEDLEKILGSRLILKRLKQVYVEKIANNPLNASSFRREFLGRAGSVLRSLRPAFRRVKNSSQLLSDLPDLDEGSFKVVVAGAPHVGKSSLVANLTTRKIKIGSYPFTTKEIYAGELVGAKRRVIVYDTPGLLNRPLEERNKIELRAIAALRYLADTVLFLIDPTERAGYSMAYQEEIMLSLSKFLRNLDFIKVYTHADELPSIPTGVLCVSNITMYGLDRLKKELLERADKWYYSHFHIPTND